jgi:hypothetical protein
MQLRDVIILDVLEDWYYLLIVFASAVPVVTYSMRDMFSTIVVLE